MGNKYQPVGMESSPSSGLKPRVILAGYGDHHMISFDRAARVDE
jgi:hypothetical protein